jgi:redox-sensing transcriptional repressor
MFSQGDPLPFDHVSKKARVAALRTAKISESTIRRLSLYHRLLQEAEALGQPTISSEDLADRSGTTAAQVRKDLSVFGSFGKRGLGYGVGELLRELREILGLDREWRVALVGAGKIGSALISYSNFRMRGFRIEAVFDSDPEKVGRRWASQVVLDDREMEQVLRERAIEIVVVAVPAEAAQGVVDRIVDSGVTAILNFAPIRLRVPDNVALKNVDLVVEMEGLAFAVNSRQGSGEEGRAFG